MTVTTKLAVPLREYKNIYFLNVFHKRKSICTPYMSFIMSLYIYSAFTDHVVEAAGRGTGHCPAKCMRTQGISYNPLLYILTMIDIPLLQMPAFIFLERTFCTVSTSILREAYNFKGRSGAALSMQVREKQTRGQTRHRTGAWEAVAAPLSSDLSAYLSRASEDQIQDYD